MERDRRVEPGRIYDGYVFDSVLGEGATTVVYLAQHAGRGTWHAIKVLRITDSRRRIRIEQEAVFRDELRHPNIVPATEAIDVNDHAALVMDFVEGPSLAQWLADDPTSDLTQRLELFRGVVEGVRHAHAHQVVHRDLKPSNVLLQPGQGGAWVPRISDFGLAKAMSPEIGRFGGLTTVNTGLGSVGYAAPEQVRDAAHVDDRADLYSLGCLLFELVCGIGPFAGRSTFDTMQAQASGDHPDPRQLAPGLPAELYALIRQLMSVDPANRPAGCDEVLDRVDALRHTTGAIDAAGSTDDDELPTTDEGGSELKVPLLLCGAPLLALGLGSAVVFLT